MWQLSTSRSVFVGRWLLIAAIGLISACNEQTEGVTSSESVSSDVLVTVNGDGITEEDVDQAIQRTFSQADQLMLNDTVRKKVLESLIASKALKQKALLELSSDAVAEVEAQTRAYQEELLVKAYLQLTVVPAPVSTAMVERYYQENPQRFGGSTIKTFELLRMGEIPSEAERDAVLSELDQIRKTKSWKDSASVWQEKLGLVYQQAEAAPGLLEKPLASALATLSEGQTSDVVFIESVPHLLRVIDVRQLPPRPLSEVSSEIRKALAPMQMRQAVKAVSDEALADAEISYQQ